MEDNSIKTLAIPLWGLFIIGMLATLYFAKAVFIPVFLAIMVSFVLRPAVRWLQTFHIPRALSSALILLVLSLLIIGAFNLLAEPATMWFDRLPTEIHQLEEKLFIFKDSIESVQKTTERFQEITSISNDATSKPQEIVVKGPTVLYKLLNSTQSFLIGMLSFVVLLYFLLTFGDALTRTISQLWDNRQDRRAMIDITHEVRTHISHYLLLITAINICLGIAVTLTMWIVGMPNPLVWGTSAALLNYIPYVGQAINLGIVTLVALLTFDTPLRILLPPLILLGLNILEGQFIQPLFVGKMFTINPILVFLSVLGWGWLWGIAGIFMAVPLLMITKIIWDQNRENPGDSPNLPKES